MTTDQLQQRRERLRSIPRPPAPVDSPVSQPRPNLDREALEAAALQAHDAGTSWSEFWRCHAADIDAIFGKPATPWGSGSAGRRKLISRLTHLLASGDTDGQHPAGDGDAAPERDDAAGPVVNDSETSARCL